KTAGEMFFMKAQVGGNFGFFWSVDGLSISSQTTGDQDWDVAYGAGKYVAVGEDERIRIMTGGSSWVNATGIPSGFTSEAIAYGNGFFLAANEGSSIGGRVWKSADGNNFIAYTANINVQGRDHLVFSNGYFILNKTGTLYRSTDGITWS